MSLTDKKGNASEAMTRPEAYTQVQIYIFAVICSYGVIMAGLIMMLIKKSLVPYSDQSVPKNAGFNIYERDSIDEDPLEEFQGHYPEHIEQQVQLHVQDDQNISGRFFAKLSKKQDTPLHEPGTELQDKKHGEQQSDYQKAKKQIVIPGYRQRTKNLDSEYTMKYLKKLVSEIQQKKARTLQRISNEIQTKTSETYLKNAPNHTSRANLGKQDRKLQKKKSKKGFEDRMASSVTSVGKIDDETQENFDNDDESDIEIRPIKRPEIKHPKGSQTDTFETRYLDKNDLRSKRSLIYLHKLAKEKTSQILSKSDIRKKERSKDTYNRYSAEIKEKLRSYSVSDIELQRQISEMYLQEMYNEPKDKKYLKKLSKGLKKRKAKKSEENVTVKHLQEAASQLGSNAERYLQEFYIEVLEERFPKASCKSDRQQQKKTKDVNDNQPKHKSQLQINVADRHLLKMIGRVQSKRRCMPLPSFKIVTWKMYKKQLGGDGQQGIVIQDKKIKVADSTLVEKLSGNKLHRSGTKQQNVNDNMSFKEILNFFESLNSNRQDRNFKTSNKTRTSYKRAKFLQQSQTKETGNVKQERKREVRSKKIDSKHEENDKQETKKQKNRHDVETNSQNSKSETCSQEGRNELQNTKSDKNHSESVESERIQDLTTKLTLEKQCGETKSDNSLSEVKQTENEPFISQKDQQQTEDKTENKDAQRSKTREETKERSKKTEDLKEESCHQGTLKKDSRGPQDGKRNEENDLLLSDAEGQHYKIEKYVEYTSENKTDKFRPEREGRQDKNADNTKHQQLKKEDEVLQDNTRKHDEEIDKKQIAFEFLQHSESEESHK